MTSSLRSLLWPRQAALVLAVLCIGVAFRFAFSNEVPVGTVRGTVLLDENHKPVADAEITFYPTSPSANETHRQRFTVSNDDGKFALTHLPAGDYRVYARTDSHAVTEQFVDVQEGKTNSSRTDAGPARSRSWLSKNISVSSAPKRRPIWGSAAM